MIHDRNIVCIASSWFDHPTSKHQVMRILAEQNDVIWVNCHASRCPTLSKSDASAVFRRLRRVWAGPQRVAPRIDVLSPLLLPFPRNRLARFLNARILGRHIRRSLRDRVHRPSQLWLFTPDVPELIGRLSFERVIYYCVDDFAAFSGFDTALVSRLEAQTVLASDAVIATSTELYEARRRQHYNTHLVPHGVDFEHFAAAPDLSWEEVPADIRQVPPPILGYFGLISDYVDLELLATAARRRPDWSFVLLGDRRCPIDALAALPNVHWLGGKPYGQLPAYCRAFDVGLIPFRMNRLTWAVNPIKLREYLAAGLPVVSAPMPEVRRYAPAVRTAETVDEFLAACSAALSEAGPERRAARQELVRPESWRARVELLSAIVEGDGDEARCAASAPHYRRRRETGTVSERRGCAVASASTSRTTA